MFKIIVSLFLILIQFHCLTKEVVATDPNLRLEQGFLFYKGEPFHGVIILKLDGTKVTRETNYLQGLKHGKEIEFYENGELASERIYLEGKREKVHRGWYPDGKDRFYYEYENDLMHGNLWEWKPDGSLYTFAKMKKGHEVARKVWREDGQIYANYIQTSSRTLGLRGAKLCKQVKSDDDGITAEF